MARTYAHTPYHVHARRDPDAVINHIGCQYDPRGVGRLVRYDYYEVHEEADWRPRVFEVDSWYSIYADRFVYDPDTQFYLLEGTTEPVPIPQRGEISVPHGTKYIYAPAKFITREPVREIVDCDVDDVEARGCYRTSDEARIQAFGHRHKCDWAGLKRDLWYSPERQRDREFCRQAAAEYNTYGEAPTDEPYIPGSPSGLWGGGWVD